MEEKIWMDNKIFLGGENSECKSNKDYFSPRTISTHKNPGRFAPESTPGFGLILVKIWEKKLPELLRFAETMK